MQMSIMKGREVVNVYWKCSLRLNPMWILCAGQVDAIKENKPLMVVGTPGRLAELSRAGALLTHPVSMLVLDEVSKLATSS